jgi:hypothetical protein
VVGVHVREKNVAQRKADAVTHHLPLRSLAAIEHESLSFADERD